MLMRIWNKWTSHTLLSGMKKWFNHFGKILVISYKVKQESSNPTPGYLPKRNKNIYLHKEV